MQDDHFQAGHPLTEEEFQSGVTENKGGTGNDYQILKKFYNLFCPCHLTQLLWRTDFSLGNIKRTALDCPAATIRMTLERKMQSINHQNYFPFQVGLIQTKQALRLPALWLKSDCTRTSSNDYITDLCLISYFIPEKIVMCVLATLFGGFV